MMGRTRILGVVFAALVIGATVVGAVAPVSPAGASNHTCPASVDTDVEGWVCMLYRLELFRSPSDAEVAFWTGVHGSQGPFAVTHGIILSDESARGYVAFVYDTQLGRSADAGGLDFWSQRVREAQSELPFELGMFSSEEFLDTFVDAEEYVLFLYDYYFDRAGDPDGVAFWVGELESEARTPAQVVEIFQHADEAGIFVTELAYADMLDRAPDQAGLDFWAPRGAQVGLLKLLAEIGGFPEAIAILGAEGQAGVAAAAGAATEAGAADAGAARRKG